MFNRNKIKKLRGDLDFLKDVVLSMKNDFDKKVESLETEIWRLKNPPKFKAGDKISCYLVLNSIVTVYNKPSPDKEKSYFWEYNVFNEATEETQIKTSEYLMSCKETFYQEQKAPRKLVKKK